MKRGIPVMSGPRISVTTTRPAGFAASSPSTPSGVTFLGVNTDAPVVPEEELFFQATMAVRFGWTEEEALRGLTIEPAKALMIDKRVGSLEPGKDADILLITGSILDPRSFVTQVLIDGKVVYDTKKDRRRF